jgi:hypothetical protein
MGLHLSHYEDSMRRKVHRPTSLHQRKPRKRRKKIDDSAARGVVLVIIFYIVIASLVYRFRHPDQTGTELFINFPDAMMWR